METFDVVVVGGGPGGYVAAIRAAQLGRSVALVEKEHLGGTCLNFGCIPSKTLLHLAEIVETIKKAGNWGIHTGDVVLSLKQMTDHKDRVVNQLRNGVASLLKSRGVRIFHGFARVRPDRTVTVHADGKPSAETVAQIRAHNVILATGSKPFVPSIPGVEEAQVHTSDTIFSLERMPKSMVIVGGGVIGVELAAVFSAFGVEVSVVEIASRIVPAEDADASAVLAKSLKSKNVNVLTETRVERIAKNGEQKIVSLRTGEKTFALEADEVLVAVGRTPNLGGIDSLGLRMNGPFVAVDEYMRTGLPGIYAIGDLIGGLQLAHVASAEGVAAAEHIAGRPRKMDYRAVPRCIYTHPEIASVGLSVEEAKQKGYSVKTEKFPLRANGKAVAMGETEGFVKLICETKYGEILGAVMVGPRVTEMISEVTAFMRLEGTVEELANVIHPHPTISESLFEAADAWLTRRTSLS